MLTIYHYPNCSTCKRALAWLRTHAIPFTAVDLVATPPTAATLRDIAQRTGAPLKKLFNIAGASYRDGDFKTRLPTLTDDQALAALAADGKLIKRPLAVSPTVALIGFDEPAWRAALG